MKILKYSMIITLIVVIITGYVYWMNYNLDTNLKFSEVALYIDEDGTSREIDIEFDVIILENKYDKNYELSGDILIDDGVFSYGDEHGFRVHNINHEYFVGFAPPKNEFSLALNYNDINGIIRFSSDSCFEGGVIYFPYKGETMNDMLDKISVLEEIKYEFYYNK